jgi:hypothetical protein
MRRVPTLASALALAAVLLGLAACDTSAPVEEEQLVIEAFAVTGEAPPPVLLRRTMPLGGTSTDDDAATGGAVTLRLDGQAVPYREAAPGRYVPAEDADAPVLAPGTHVRFEARWQGRTATAEAVAPPPLALDSVRLAIPDAPVLAVQVDSLRRDSLDVPAEQTYIYPIDVTLYWSGMPPPEPPPMGKGEPWMRTLLDPFDPFSSVLVDFFLRPEAVFREREAAGAGAGRPRWQGVYALGADGPEAPLVPHRLRVAVVRGDSAYAAFATSRDDPDRREPVSNVTGGLGLATAVALDTLTLSVD